MKLIGNSLASFLIIALIGSAGVIGCRDNSPPPPRVPVPVPNSDTRDHSTPISRRDTEMKPLPPRTIDEISALPPFDDAPLVTQQVPEQNAFLDAYRRVGQPRIAVFVNRTLEGNSARLSSKSAAVTASGTRRDSRSSADLHETSDSYLRPGQYDEASAKSLDYQAVQNSLADVLACNGQVTIISPSMARQHLTDQQIKDIHDGHSQALNDALQQLGADIFVEVQAHPIRQTRDGLEVHLIAEAMNVKGGQSLGRAVVDVPPPLEETTINRSTRFMGRKLMDEMIGSWLAPVPPPVPNDAPTTRP